MAKLTRANLKMLVKECLVELLAEGLSDNSSVLRESLVRHEPPAVSPVSGRSGRLQENRSLHTPENPDLDGVKFDNAVNTAVRELTTNPMMADIFADTARTTLQEQNAAGSPRSAGSTADMTEAFDAPGGDVSNVEAFSGAASNWETLAFGGASKKP
jgi:hypothetical protein